MLTKISGWRGYLYQRDQEMNWQRPLLQHSALVQHISPDSVQKPQLPLGKKIVNIVRRLLRCSFEWLSFFFYLNCSYSYSMQSRPLQHSLPALQDPSCAVHGWQMFLREGNEQHVDANISEETKKEFMWIASLGAADSSSLILAAVLVNAALLILEGAPSCTAVTSAISKE